MIEQLRGQLAQLGHKLTHPAEVSAQIRQQLQNPAKRVGVGLIGGTLVWVLFLLIVYPLASLTCRWGWFAATGGISLQFIQILVAVGAAGMVAAAGYGAFTVWQRGTAAEANTSGESQAANVPMLAFVILLLNALYLLIILVSLAPILALAPCR